MSYNAEIKHPVWCYKCQGWRTFTVIAWKVIQCMSCQDTQDNND